MLARPHQEGEGRQVRGSERDRGLQITEGDRVQVLRDRGEWAARQNAARLVLAVHERPLHKIPHVGSELTREQHTSGNKKAEEDAEKATEKQLEEIKQIGEKTGPKVRTVA